jgi:NAD(P)-dependent dehydrogenase (short-subunit alcohol dehydrogenase family)
VHNHEDWDAVTARRTAIVTGAGRGIGAAHARALAAAGYAVVVNDRGAASDGGGVDATPAESVVAEIVGAGGSAMASDHDVTSFDQMADLVSTVVDRFGAVDAVVTNAGILRDRMLTSMTEQDWDDVIAVHLKGTFALAHHCAAHWRARTKAGEKVDGRLVTTSSASGLYGNVSQSNYGAAKAGVAAFTVIVAQELRPYGVTANCVAPSAITRLTEGPLAAYEGELTQQRRDELDPRWISRVVAWLCSPAASDVSGHVFDVRGRQVGIASGWSLGETVTQPDDDETLTKVLAEVVRTAPSGADMEGHRLAGSRG